MFPNFLANQIMGMVRQNPEQFYNQMVQTNPQFRQFVEENQGKTPEELIKKYNINPILLKGLLK